MENSEILENMSQFSNSANTTDSVPELSIQGLVFSIGILPLINVIGTFTNAVTCKVLWNKKHWDSTDILFAALTVDELSILLFLLIENVINIYIFVNFLQEPPFLFHRSTIKEVNLSVRAFLVTVPRVIVMTIAIQRFMAVKSLVNYKRICSPRNTKIIIVILLAFATIAIIVESLGYAKEWMKCDVVTGRYFIASESGTLVYKVYIVLFFVVFVTPTLTMCGFYFGTLILIVRHPRSIHVTRTTTERQHTYFEITVAKSCMILITLNLVCSIPLFVSVVGFGVKQIDTLHIVRDESNQAGNVMYDIGQALYSLNMAINCVMYVMRSPKYKEILKEIMTKSTTNDVLTLDVATVDSNI